MDVALLIGAVILVGMGLGWVLHSRSVGRLTPVLRRLAAETDGEVKSQGPFVMPKLVFSYSGTDAEVSSASTGIDGDSIRYTYVLFKGLGLGGFKFRIRPRSLQAVVDEWAGFKKPVATAGGKLKERLAISTNDDRVMDAILSERIQTDLLFWAGGKRENRISDVRNYDDKLIYAVTDTLNSYEEFKVLLYSACRFLDAVNNAASNASGESSKT